ncbi:MAG TPA: di-heme oxidoredictase family protein [Polyangiaceae bacterium]|jgi:CxxC motif-containing protein (DUF1111 family)
MKTKSFDYLLVAGVVGSLGAAPGCSSQSGGTASLTQAAAVASDPGPAAGAPRAGGPNGAVGTLNSDEQGLFAASLTTFNEIDSVAGQIAGEDGAGLGPTFNMNSCAGCHIHPDVGGGSPAIDSGVTGNSTLDGQPIARQNPQIAVARLDGAANVIPPFITADGPVREARLKTDNGVHDLFSIAGRSDAPGCAGLAFDFGNEIANDNVVFRIPLSTFGLGLVELVTDDTLTNNLASDQFGDPPQFGKHTVFNITGGLNHSGNDGTVTRFGWKAQNKSLLMFSGEAYNVEQGVSNVLFPNERAGAGTNMNGCFSLFNSVPEDVITLPGAIPPGAQAAYEAFPDIMRFTFFMEMTAPPAPATPTPSTTNGSAVFDQVGCSGCHTRTLQTGPKSMFTGMENQTIHPFSDFAIHDMGSVLADGVSQGSAGPTQFRSTPLWGVGQRVFFLHDGRTRDIREAILAHSNGDGEAAVSINQFQQLSGSDQQDLLNFLRSL